MKIDTSEPSLTALFERGQVGLIRLEFQRKDDVIESLQGQVSQFEEHFGYAKNLIKHLEAEFERLTFDPLTYLDDQGEWMPRHIHLAAVERLKAEVERLRASSFVTAVPVEQYERLVKAGDAMADQIYNEGKVQGICYASNIEAWKAAKEGKPSV